MKRTTWPALVMGTVFLARTLAAVTVCDWTFTPDEGWTGYGWQDVQHKGLAVSFIGLDDPGTKDDRCFVDVRKGYERLCILMPAGVAGGGGQPVVSLRFGSATAPARRGVFAFEAGVSGGGNQQGTIQLRAGTNVLLEISDLRSDAGGRGCFLHGDAAQGAVRHVFLAPSAAGDQPQPSAFQKYRITWSVETDGRGSRASLRVERGRPGAPAAKASTELILSDVPFLVEGVPDNIRITAGFPPARDVGLYCNEMKLETE